MAKLGPLLFATIRCADAAGTAAIYQQYLHLKIKREEVISAELAALLAAPSLKNTPCFWLGSKTTKPWLRILELPADELVVPLKRRGWMSLEISVSDVDDLALQLSDSPFTTLGDPANLAFNDSIRAMQVTGPAQEVLYLTEIKEKIPVFQLKPATAPVERLFIGVLASADRKVSGDFYHSLGSEQPLLTDTRIGVLNRAWQRDDNHQYPIAITQLADYGLLEIDHLPEAARLTADHSPPAGIASLGFSTDKLSALPCHWRATPKPVADFPWLGRLGGCTTGPDGEWIEFVEQPVPS